MKDEEDKSNQPTMPPPPGHDVEELTVAGTAPPEILALLAEKKKQETAPVLTSSTLEDDEGWGASEPAEPAPKALTDSMPTPQAFEIYNAPAAPAASSLSTETPAIDFYPMDLPREVEAKIASRGIQSSSMPTPIAMPVQMPPSMRTAEIAVATSADATPAAAAIEPAPADAKAATLAAPMTPAARVDDPKKESAPPKPVASITSIPPPAKSTLDKKFVAAVIGAIVILAAIGAWALR